MSTKKMLLGIIVGAALGTVFAVLLKPFTESTIRKSMVKKIAEYSGNAGEKYGEYAIL